MEWTFVFVHEHLIGFSKSTSLQRRVVLVLRKHLDQDDEDEKIRRSFRVPETWGRSIPGAKAARMKYEPVNSVGDSLLPSQCPMPCRGKRATMQELLKVGCNTSAESSQRVSRPSLCLFDVPFSVCR
jgi:hypothetical protein